MKKKAVLSSVCLAILLGTYFSAGSLAEILVGVKEGDFVEYQVASTGEVPKEHDVNKAKIEVTGVEGKKINIKLTSTFSAGEEETVDSILNFETGQIGDGFIIPADLSAGDTFLEQTEGNITISKVEEKIFAGAKRTVVSATTSHTRFYWDKSTGFLVEATSTYTDFTITTKAEKTNIWQTQIFEPDLVVFIIIVVLVITAVVILLRLKMKK